MIATKAPDADSVRAGIVFYGFGTSLIDVDIFRTYTLCGRQPNACVEYLYGRNFITLPDILVDDEA